VPRHLICRETFIALSKLSVTVLSHVGLHASINEIFSSRGLITYTCTYGKYAPIFEYTNENVYLNKNRQKGNISHIDTCA